MKIFFIILGALLLLGIFVKETTWSPPEKAQFTLQYEDDLPVPMEYTKDSLILLGLDTQYSFKIVKRIYHKQNKVLKLVYIDGDTDSSEFIVKKIDNEFKAWFDSKRNLKSEEQLYNLKWNTWND